MSTSSTPNRPRPLGSIVPTLTKDVFGKKSMLFGKMVSEWAAIAGADIADRATPLELKFSKKAENGNQAVLHLAVLPAFALELSYQKNLLMERLNAFFGYPAIKDIKIIQHSEVMNNKKSAAFRQRTLNITDEKKISVLVEKIGDEHLQTALKNLGKAIVSRQDRS